MKQLKTSGVYKASNVTYDPKTRRAFSYVWWQFVDVVNGETVFNNYHYSQSTCGHQGKVRSLMMRLGHNIDRIVEVPKGLQQANVGRFAVEYAVIRIEALQRKQTEGRPGTWAYKFRAEEIARFESQKAWGEALQAQWEKEQGLRA